MRRLIILAFALAGCGNSGATYTVTFAPLVAGAPFSCTQTYPSIGTSHTTMTPIDLRMYVHDVQLVRASGQMVPLALKPDGVWQDTDIALLDFEDGTGSCMTNSPQTNFSVVGTAAEHSDYQGVQFTMGIPADHDHLNAATAMAPLNEPAMWWSWVGGYRYLRFEAATTVNPTWFFHLGAEACSGASNTAITCKYPDLTTITLSGFNPKTNKVAFDLATLFADSNLDAQPDPMITTVTGCMSDSGNPQCMPLFAKLGLTFESNDPGPAQTVFAVSQ